MDLIDVSRFRASSSFSISQFLSLFKRVTSSGGFISEIDGLRFIAIITVVLFHLAVGLNIKSPVEYAIPKDANWFSQVVMQGFHGVELFFIISGFILAFPFASHFLKGKKNVNLGQYFFRRLTRLEPPYIICMVIFFILRVTIQNVDVLELFPHLAASLFYLHNFIFNEPSIINDVAWSLEIEIQFYLLVPILSRLFILKNKFKRRLLIIIIGLMAILLSSTFITPDERIYHSILNYLQFFLVGFLLADIYLTDWNGKPTTNLNWDIVSILGWPILFIIFSSPIILSSFLPIEKNNVIQNIMFPVIAFFLYSAAFKGRFTNIVFTNPWITTIGGMCYSIYLLHNSIIGVIIGFTKVIVPVNSYAINFIIQSIIVLPIMMIPIGIYFLTIEKPCMFNDWPKRLLERLRSIVPPSAS